MSKTVVIKQVGVEVLKDIVPLLVAYRAFYQRESASEETVSAFVEEHLNNNIVTIFLAYVDGEAVGIAQLYHGYSTLSLRKVWFLYDLFISESSRGLGLGRKLLQHCQKFAKDDGAFKLELKTELDNAPARALYEKFGFSANESHMHYHLMLD